MDERQWATAEANSRKMMAARGYSVFGAEGTGRDYVCECADLQPRRLVTFMEASAKLGLKEVRTLEERTAQLGLTHTTIVMHGSVTPPAKDRLRTQGAQVEIFAVSELLFNLVDHSLVPPHRLLTAKEREAVFEQYGAAGLPRMLLTDPVSRYYGLKRGQVMEIERVNASGFHKVYRIAV